MRGPPEVRFFSRVEKTANCWNWSGGTSEGYGMFYDGTKNVRAHRWSYEHHVGQIPKGRVIDHLCRNTLCVNPDHLEPTGIAENALRGRANGGAMWLPKTHCVNGHALTDENTHVGSNGFRYCRTCKRIASRHYKRQQRAKRPPELRRPLRITD